MPTAHTDLSETVRRVDEDRWLASRFAPAEARARLMALYAMNYEIARTAAVVSEAAIGDIRLAWWREAIAEIYAGKRPRAHPVVAAFAAALPGADWPQAAFDALIDARGADLDAAPFADWAALQAYVDATAGALLHLGLRACGGEADAALLRDAGRAWGFAGLARARRNPLADGGATREVLLARAAEAYGAIRGARVSAAAFPALGYLALTPAYLKRDAPLLLTRQFTLIAASARGRL